MDSKKPNGTHRPGKGQTGHPTGTQTRRRAAMMRKRRRRKQIWAGVMAVSLGSAAILICILLSMYSEEQREVEVQHKLQNVYRAAAEAVQTQTTDPIITASMAPEQAQNAPEEPMSDTETSGLAQKETVVAQLEELYSINPDLIGWIEMGEIISGPVVIRDNDYYLTRDFYGNQSKSGTIFADEENADWQEHPYMVLYGHNMRENTMFGKLDQLKNVDDFRQNALVEFQMLYEDEARYYLPFAVVDASVRTGTRNYFWLRRFDIFKGETRDEQKIAEFIEEITDRSLVKVPGLEVTPEDDILCLVTCSYTSDEARLMVFCRRVRENENAADMSEYINSVAQTKE